MAMLTMTSCDKDADNKKIQTVSGIYKGNVEAYLYIPDYFAELENMVIYSPDMSPALANDMDTKAEVNYTFTSGNNAVVSIRDLQGIHLEMDYLEKDVDGELATDHTGRYIPRTTFASGALAEMLTIIRACVSKEEYNAFAKNYMNKLVDDLHLINVMTKPLAMVENGAVLCSYDFEQNSIYERFYLEPFTFKRQSSMTETTQQLQVLMAAHPAEFAPYTERIKQIIGSYKMEGTISDASGWCSLTYANYRPCTSLTITKATGLIDVLSLALLGKNPDNKIDKTIWMEVYYEGTIGDMSSYEKVSGK